MKNLAVVTILTLVTATQSFASQDRGIRNRVGDYVRGRVGDYVGSRIGVQNKKFHLYLNQHLRGSNTIKLKKELKMQNPGINIQNLELVAVKLVAKSKMGRGQATFLVGQNASYPETVQGSPYEFQNNAGYTYQKLRMQNPSYGSQGKWQIQLRGNIKVKKIVLIVKKKQMRGRHIRIQMYDQHIRGLNTLKIKQLIKQQNPYTNFQSLNLQAVTLVAKSKMGRGEATLLVGQNVSYPSLIAGNPRGFQSAAPRTYTAITFQNPSASSMGKWQIELRGNIKVKEILVKIQPSYSRGNNGRVGPGSRNRGGRRGGGRH